MPINHTSKILHLLQERYPTLRPVFDYALSQGLDGQLALVWKPTDIPKPDLDELIGLAQEVAICSISAAAALRQRNALLAESDWTQLPDVPDAVSKRWRAYRKALRDLPGQPGFPAEIVWPDKPE